jgi:hypothetical protein
MDNNQTTKTKLDTTLEGKRGNGRPKLRWENSVDQDIRLLGERKWKNLALNREEWKILEKARAYIGLQSQ